MKKWKNVTDRAGIPLLGLAVAFVSIAACEKKTEASSENDPECTTSNIAAQCNIISYLDDHGAAVTAVCINNGSNLTKCVNKKDAQGNELAQVAVTKRTASWEDTQHNTHGTCKQSGTSGSVSCSSQYTTDAAAEQMNIKTHENC